jgi:basic membrane protein A
MGMIQSRLFRSFLLGVFFATTFGATDVVHAQPFKVGLVLDRGGKDDKSFNASAYKGLMEAKDKLKIDVKVVESPDNNAFENFIRSFARGDYDLIISIGFAQQEALKKVAPQFPNKKFAIVDSEVSGPNVRSLLFEEHEGSYLVGMMAAMTSKTGKVGFIGGMDIPLIRRFEKGFEAGVKKANPKAEILVNYVGVTAEAWNNPPKGKELALSQYQRGADVIFGAAGASGTGIFDAAEERKQFAIGVDSNQNWVKPGRVLTSMLKRVDQAVFQTIQLAQAGKFAPGIQRFGLANQGVDYAMDNYNAGVVDPKVKAAVEQAKKEIISGKIKVPDFYLMKK